MDTPDLFTDREHRQKMAIRLERACMAHQVRVVGEQVWGWRDRTLSSRVLTVDDHVQWLRVVAEEIRWAAGDFWTGNGDATAQLHGIGRIPHVLELREWVEDTTAVRTELMSYLDGDVCSRDPIAATLMPVSAQWWAQLRTTLTRLNDVATMRVGLSSEKVTERISKFFPGHLVVVKSWTTAHCDLHWANVLSPELGIVDWESWGRAPASYDAATLYVHSLLVPELAETVRTELEQFLQSTDGLIARVVAATGVLARAEIGDKTQLVGVVNDDARQALRKLAL
jgi:hypothetical protein